MGSAGVVFEEKIAKNLGRHNDNRRVRLELNIPRHDADLSRPHLLEIVELLVGERLDGGCVEDAAALRKAVRNLILAHQRLTRAGLRSHEHVLMLVDSGDGVLLEGV